MSKADPGIIVRRSEEELREWVSTEAGFLSAFPEYSGEKLTLEPFQRAFLNYRKPDGKEPEFRVIKKSRRIGFSFLCTMEGLARCHLRNKHTAVYVSYNLSDAKEIISEARALHEGLPLEYQKKLIVDTKTELAFVPYGGGRRHVSRMLSLPAKAPRGKDGDIYLDEFAHSPDDDVIFTGATALIMRSTGQLTMCSTPLGKRGVFWDVNDRTDGKHTNFTRFSYPWWLCEQFCKDIFDASINAGGMLTHERVAKYGKPAIVSQFSTLILESFQQEFECLFIDESTAFLPYDLILSCMLDEPEPGQRATKRNLIVSDDVGGIPKPIGRLTVGVDVARRTDLTSISIMENVGGHWFTRMQKEMSNVKLRVQGEYFRKILKTLPIARFSIDATGIGEQLAEDLHDEFPDIVVPEHFTAPKKERWANNMKSLMQERKIVLPRRRKLLSQIHAVRKKVSSHGTVQFLASRSRDGHADNFWSLALACQSETASAGGGTISVRVIGGRRRKWSDR